MKWETKSVWHVKNQDVMAYVQVISGQSKQVPDSKQFNNDDNFKKRTHISLIIQTDKNRDQMGKVNLFIKCEFQI